MSLTNDFAHIQFCRASQVLSIGIWFNLDSEKFSQKKNSLILYEIMAKLAKKGCEYSTFGLSSLSSRTFWKNVLYMISCRIIWATQWYKSFSGSRHFTYTFRPNTEKWSKTYMLKNHCIWRFLILKWVERKIPYIQFCRASQPLSIGIWLDLNSK
jgi:hypothetical protein